MWLRLPYRPATTSIASCLAGSLDVVQSVGVRQLNDQVVNASLQE